MLMPLDQKARELADRQNRETPIDWEANKAWWLEKLEALYGEIEAWLKPLADQDLVDASRDSVPLTEEHIGTYEADVLLLDFSGKIIVLEPRGTLLIGSRGRVDVFLRGHRARPIMLILEGDRDSASWGIWKSRHPRDRLDLTKDTFEKAVEDLLP